jgi:pimeloyl-ACP methyl ester carboxylesterase
MNIDSCVTLRDGRKLAYTEFGLPNGHPVLYFPGSPSSRLEPLLISVDTLSRLGLRVIAPDRPGIGQSDFQPDRGFSDWPEDVIALADALELRRFAVLGNSGGGPYVAVCAARIPERLSAAVIVSGGWRMDWPEAKDNMPFMNRLVMTLARKTPFLLRLLLKAMASASTGERDKELAQLKKRLPPADYAAFEQRGRVEALGKVVRECMRQGTTGAAWDMRMYVREFDFQSDEIKIPLTWFHGQQDVNAPLSMVQKVISGLPSAQLVTYEGEAHLSTLCNHMDEIAGALVNKA